MAKNKVENILDEAQIKIPNTRRKLSISFETVTPEIADQWLNANADSQRKLSPKIASQYAEMMRKGIWKHDNGEGIKFDSKGRLCDGQHRLMAVIEFGHPQTFLVTRGLDPEAIKAMDTGKKRSLADMFKINGIEPPSGMSESVLASLMSSLYVAKSYAAVQQSETHKYSLRGRSRIDATPLELYEFAIKNPIIFEKLNKLKNRPIASYSKRMNISGVLLGWMLIDAIDPVVADQILSTFDTLMPQTTFGRNCPALTIVSYLKRIKDNNEKINNTEYAWIWIWAYDHIVREATVKSIRPSLQYMPAQGHEGTKELKDFLGSLKV